MNENLHALDAKQLFLSFTVQFHTAFTKTTYFPLFLLSLPYVLKIHF